MQTPRSKSTSVKRLSRDHKMPRYQTTEMHYEWSFERLFRCAGRPPLSMDRLEALPDGRLRYWFKTAWRNGRTHAIFEPLEFLEKLAALVPTPRAHLVRFHGLLAPAAKWRPSIVPHNATTEAPPDSPGTDETTATSSGGDVAHCDERQKPADAAQRHARNYAWSELMKRVRRRRLGLYSLRRPASHLGNHTRPGNHGSDSGSPRNSVTPASGGGGRLPATSLRLRMTMAN